MERLKTIIFRVGGRYFALPTKNVKEIIDSHDNLRPVFYGGRALKGVMNFGGDVVSVLDSPSILDIKEGGEGPLILICRGKDMEKGVGITVSDIAGMEVLDIDSVKPSQEKDDAYIVGFIRKEEKGEVALLDLKRFLDYADTKIVRL